MLISIKNKLKVLYKHSKIFWVGWPFDLIGNLHLKKNNAPFFFIHNNLIPRTLMAACEKVPNLISFFVCAKLRLKILLSGPQCCPRNRKNIAQNDCKLLIWTSHTFPKDGKCRIFEN